MITVKQELFVQGLVSGISQRQAYKNAYDCSNMKDSTIDNNAYKLIREPDVKARFDELIEESKERCLYSKELAVLDLIWIKEQARESIEIQGLKQANGSHFLNAVKDLCELEGLYPTKDTKDNNKQEEDVANALRMALKEI